MDFGKHIKILSKTEKVEIDKPVERKQETRFIGRIVPTENPVVNMLQAAIKWHQDNLISLRSVSLRPRDYELFKDWVKIGFMRRGKELGVEYKKVRQEMEEYIAAVERGDTTLVFYDVDIKKGASFQKDAMYFERYFQSKEQKEAYFGPVLGKA